MKVMEMTVFTVMISIYFEQYIASENTEIQWTELEGFVGRTHYQLIQMLPGNLSAMTD